LFAAAVADERFAPWKTALAWVFLGLGVLAKGPVAILLAFGIGVTFWLLDERGGVLHRWHIVTGGLIAAAVSLPWFWLVFKENGFAFIAIFFLNHNLARYITDLHHHTEGLYYYLLILPGLLFPWTGWLLLLLPRSIRDTVHSWKRWDRAVLFVACWVLFPLLFFSLSSSKLPGYILPSIPPLALLLGKRLAGWIEEGASPRRMLSSAWVHFLLSGALAIAFPVIMRSRYGMSWPETLTISAIIWVPALLTLYFATGGKATAVVRGTFVQGVLLVLALTQFAFPVLARMESTKALAAQIGSIRTTGEPLVTYHFFQHSLRYYTGYTISEDLQDHESLLAFARAHARVLVVVPAAGTAEMQNLPGFSVALVGEQGNLRLFRLSRL
jgi:4-amino-4-deoxy-L-arabinose transferase-like glycosyltransferase